MQKSSAQSGIIHFLLLVLVLVGLGVGLYLFQQGTTFRSRAANEDSRIEFFGAGISKDGTTATAQTVSINAFYAKPPSPSLAPTTGGTYSPKVLLLIYNPILATQGGKKLTDYRGWSNPDTLTSDFIKDMKAASNGVVNYQIAQRVEVTDMLPIKADGFQYTEQSYLACVNSGGSQCHNPDLADYKKMIEQVDACGKRNRGEIDELWIFGGPWFGYWESNLTGPNAFWYNSSPTLGTACTKLLPIMGFNYERGEEVMLHDVGHRIESTMSYVYGGWGHGEGTAWDKFALRDNEKPGRGGCGNTHVPANTSGDYNYSDPKVVQSTCQDFANYPNLTGQTVELKCSTWGCDQRGYFVNLMFKYLPHSAGKSPDGKLNNWWAYVVDADSSLFATTPPTPIPTPIPVASPRVGVFTNLIAIFNKTAGFRFTYSGITPRYIIDVSTLPDMSGDVFLSFSEGVSPPVTETNPSKWDKYSCNRTLYWKVYTADRQVSSPIQTTTVGCVAASAGEAGDWLVGVVHAQSAIFPDQVKLSNTSEGLSQPCLVGVACVFTYTGNPTAISNWKLTDNASSKTVYAQFLKDNQPLGPSVSASILYSSTASLSLSATPTSVARTGNSTISWNIVGTATNCTATSTSTTDRDLRNDITSRKWSGALSQVDITPGSHSRVLTLTNQSISVQTADLSLSCTIAGKTYQASTTIMSNPHGVPVVSLSSNITSMTAQGSVDLTWKILGAPTSCSLVSSGIPQLTSGSWSGTLRGVDITEGSHTRTVTISGLIRSQPLGKKLPKMFEISCVNDGGRSPVSGVTVTVL